MLKLNGNTVKTTIFAGDYEQITAGGATQRLYYLDGGAIYVKQDGQADKVYYACTDHLGSIVKLVDGNGTEVFAATYDAWGKRTIANNTFAFHRGYTGHEHLPEFDLINMNGRLYDPTIGRFLSCDPYVQMPDFSQNFNRYSYCLNNPLKFTDPSGELFGIDDAIIISAVVIGAMQAGAQAQMNGKSFWSGAWKGAAIGAATSLIPYGVGQVFGHQVGTLGNELLRAGAHGLGNGLLNVAEGGKFGAGFATGVAASLAGSAFMTYGGSFASSTLGNYAFSGLAGGVGAGLTGGNFWKGAANGVMTAGLNHLQHSIESSVQNAHGNKYGTLEEYRAWRDYPGYHEGETRFERICRLMNSSHIEILANEGSGGGMMYGGFGRVTSTTSKLLSTERQLEAIVKNTTRILKNAINLEFRSDISASKMWNLMKNASGITTTKHGFVSPNGIKWSYYKGGTTNPQGYTIKGFTPNRQYIIMRFTH